MPATTFPPFPEDIPTHPVLVIDFALVKEGNKSEIDRLWEAGTKLGFWYLKNHGADEEVAKMFEIGVDTLALPVEERMKFVQGEDGFGYKPAGVNQVDEYGQKDTVEFLNIAEDDVLAWPQIVHRSYPPTVNAQMNSVVIPFVHKSLEVNRTLLNAFNDRLRMPPETLLKLHIAEERSGCQVRLTRTPPTESKQTLGSHTDYGSLSFLHNRLGGLQVLVPGSDTWQYVKPIPGHAICNIGDALSLLTGGILRSNLHRVVSPPGYQATLERWSLVFFTRPNNYIPLRALVEDSPMILEAVNNSPEVVYDTGYTAWEWVVTRIRNSKLKKQNEQTWMNMTTKAAQRES